jgi:voltage-dependent potassium channel beta subunit
MDYRRLGRSGLQVSVLSLGSWVTFGEQMNLDRAMECLDAAYQAGVNFFDNAESYAGGDSEKIMGEAISKLGWPRYSYVISTKVFWGLHDLPNMRNTLNRKYLMQAIDGSLERLGLDFVDLLFCHRADPNTTIEETTRAMSDIVASGKALYWGTSEWTPDEIRAAWEIADKHGWHKPVMEQSQYNLFRRMRIEIEYLRLYEEIGLGTTIYSPLASGVLSGKYLDGVPSDSRGALEGYEWLSHSISDQSTRDKVRALKAVADDLGCTTAQLALAWCTKNKHVSTVITGASRPEQVTENMLALDVAKKLDREVMARIEQAVPFTG